MAYNRRRRRSYPRGSVSSKRQTLTAKTWGRFGLTTANQQIAPLDLLNDYQASQASSGSVDLGRATVLGVRGWITWAYGTDTITDAEAMDTRIGFGIRVMSSAARGGLDNLTERQGITPYPTVPGGYSGGTGNPAYDSWMWRRSRPMYDDSPGDGTAPALLRDQERNKYIWDLAFKINTKNMRKLAIGESLYLFGGLNFDPGSAGDVECRYEFNTVVAKP